MKRVMSTCDWCGSEFEKFEHELHKHNFCCIEHLRLWNRKRISEYNKSDNPMNMAGSRPHDNIPQRARMPRHVNAVKRVAAPSPKDSIEWHNEHRKKRLKENIKGYRKYFGRHEHRVVAESILGRQLLPGEVVHHVDGNKSNNAPDNLMVFASQSEHVKYHASLRKKEGDVR